MSTPQSVISVCSGVRLDSRYRNTIYFSNAAAQEEYFAGKVARTFSAYSYLRKSWSIKVNSTMEQAKAWSYLFFKNAPSFKTYYYFINQIEYVNDNTVELFLELDVMQTYLFDITLLPSFVERQHTTSDEIGEHTIDEGLDVGEIITNGTRRIILNLLAIMVSCTINPNVTEEGQVSDALPYMYNNVFSGIKLWAVSPYRWQEWAAQLETLNDIGQIEAISQMWMYPMELIKLGGEAQWEYGDIAHPVEGAYSVDDNPRQYNVPKQLTTIDGYTPKNNKLFCYPYNFLYCTNNEGTHAVYHYERFNTEGDNVYFELTGSVSPGGGVRLVPQQYDGIFSNYNEGMSLTGLPSCAWNSDIYKLWLAQNQNQHQLANTTAGIKIAGGVVSAIGGAVLSATGAGAIVGAGGIGGGIATAVSGAQEIASLLAQTKDKELVPPQANGSFSSSVNITNNELGFRFYYKSVKAETARIIDDYFTMYGYKINRVQTPNINARPGFTYVKTIGCNIHSRICNEDLLKIESIFDNGVTFWTDGDKIGLYNQNNSPS